MVTYVEIKRNALWTQTRTEQMKIKQLPPPAPNPHINSQDVVWDKDLNADGLFVRSS